METVTFQDVMNRMPFSLLYSILQNPRTLTQDEMFCLSYWMRPKIIVSYNTGDLLILTGVARSKTDARTKVKTKAVRFNTDLVEDVDENQFFSLFYPGYGIIQYGKKTFVMVTKYNWIGEQGHEQVDINEDYLERDVILNLFRTTREQL